MNFVRWTSQSLKCQMFTPSGCKDIGIWILELVARTQEDKLCKFWKITMQGLEDDYARFGRWLRKFWKMTMQVLEDDFASFGRWLCKFWKITLQVSENNSASFGR